MDARGRSTNLHLRKAGKPGGTNLNDMRISSINKLSHTVKRLTNVHVSLMS